MNRRQFTQSIFYSLAAYAVSAKASLFPDQTSPIKSSQAEATSTLARNLSRLFSSPKNASAIGQRYIELYPEKMSSTQLANDLGDEIIKLALSGDNMLKQRIARQQQNDFSEGNTVIVNNWILSRTEASVCALIACS
ncbi:MAG: hypothetical protein V3W04_14230 [Gammaproteobacteria bacterium]